jgi:hypothetical protein
MFSGEQSAEDELSYKSETIKKLLEGGQTDLGPHPATQPRTITDAMQKIIVTKGSSKPDPAFQYPVHQLDHRVLPSSSKEKRRKLEKNQ